MRAKALGKTSQNHNMDQSRTLGAHCEKEENQYELYPTELIPNGSEWTILTNCINS